MDHDQPTAPDRLHRQITFLMEADRVKTILRRNRVVSDPSRRENDAEHMYHFALMATVLAEYSDAPVDLLRVLKMVLIHDLVEIDAGDVFVYDEQALVGKREREELAADRIFNLLPADQAQEMRALWEEFETEESAEARFAAALDRLQPLLGNYYTQGGAWQRPRHQRGPGVRAKLQDRPWLDRALGLRTHVARRRVGKGLPAARDPGQAGSESTS